MATVAATEQTLAIPAGLESWPWNSGCDGSYVHLNGGTATAELPTGGEATAELAYIPGDDPEGAGFMVMLDLPERDGRRSFAVTAAEARILAETLIAALTFLPEAKA